MDHKHGENCGCGAHHDDHGENCGCGAHHHDHGENCGCGGHHDHGPDCGCHTYEGTIDGLNADEATILHVLGTYHYLPVAQFVLVSSVEDSLQMIALSPVAIQDENDDMATVKSRGEVLNALEEKGLITLDYDIPISGYTYDGYRQSALFAGLQQAVEESKGQTGFLFDGADVIGGSMALTDAGEALLKA